MRKGRVLNPNRKKEERLPQKEISIWDLGQMLGECVLIITTKKNLTEIIKQKDTEFHRPKL